MKTIRLSLILLALGCAEPTATLSRPAGPQAAVVGQKSNSYFINGTNRTVYLTVVQLRGETGEPVHAFMRRMFVSADSAGAQRLVVDLRLISDGDVRLLVPLIKGVATRDRFVKRGGVYVVVGADSFSPRQNAARLLEQYASPIFVDEAP
jgi:hypothetical protein